MYSRRSEAYPLAERILLWLNRTTGLPNRGCVCSSGAVCAARTNMPPLLGWTNYNDANLMNTRPDLFAQGYITGCLTFRTFSVNLIMRAGFRPFLYQQFYGSYRCADCPLGVVAFVGAAVKSGCRPLLIPDDMKNRAGAESRAARRR